MISLACNFVTGLDPTSQPTAEVTAPSSAASGGFSAEAVEGGVALKWEAVSGAEQYLIEMQTGDEFIPLVVLASDQLTYVDGVPGGAQYTYRLTSLSGAGRGTGKMVTVSVPEEKSEPQSVTVTLDMAPAAIDLSNFDPNNFDPTQIDPNNLNLSMFAPQVIQAESKIGPEGGEISVTGTNGVTYVLTVPPGALDFETMLRLKPISTIPDLPLSGGTLGAVLIEPEGVAFDIPATLEMIPPDGFSLPSGLPQVGFAFDASGQEFHLYPLAQGTTQSYRGVQTASLNGAPVLAPPLSEIGRLYYSGAYGLGQGTAADAQKVKSPAKSVNRAAQRAARAQMEELAPLEQIEPPADLPNLPPQAKELGKLGQSILDKAGKADSWSKLMEALDDFRMYMEQGGSQFNKGLNNQILDKLVGKIKALLDKNMEDCLSPEEMKAQEMGRRLDAPKGEIDKAIADNFKKKFGDKLLKDLLAGLKRCTFELDVYSNLTFDSQGSVMFVTIKTNRISLRVVYSKGDIFLTGNQAMTMDVKISGQGCTFPLKQYSSLELYVDRLIPIYAGTSLKDFGLELSVAGWQALKGGSAEGKKCPNIVSIFGGGDFWTGLFTISRAYHQDFFMHGWKISGGPLKDNKPLTAQWALADPSFTPYGQDARMSEDSKFTLRVTPRKNK